MSFRLEIISPKKIEFEGEIDLCIIPGIEGDFGVLSNHSPFLTSLRTGITYIYSGKKLTSTLLLDGGIAEISHNKCTILTEEVTNAKVNYIDKNTTDEKEKAKFKALEKLYYS